jgi:hypothetical protein
MQDSLFSNYLGLVAGRAGGISFDPQELPGGIPGVRHYSQYLASHSRCHSNHAT